MKTTTSLRYRFASIAIILLSILVSNVSVAQQYEWQVLDTMPFRSAALASCYYDGNIYTIGGSDGQMNNEEYGNNFFQVYDLSTNTWSLGPDLPHARMMLAAAVVDEKIYVLGGGYPPYLNNFNECFDPKTQTWTEKEPIPIATSSFSACVIDGKIYTTSGMFSGGMTYCYDPVANSWSERSPMPHFVAAHSAAAINNKIYVTGGVDGTWATIKKLQVYDTETDTWDTTKASMDTLCFGHSSAAIENEVIVMGGSVFAPNEKKAYKTVVAYNIETDTWKDITEMPDSVQWGATCSNGNKIYLVGGEDKCMMTYPDAKIFNYLFELTVTGLTAVDLPDDNQKIQLKAYPNPGHDRLEITIELRDISNIRLELYNVQGTMVSTLLNETITPGVHGYNFNITFLKSGLYFLNLKTDDRIVTEKIIKL